MLILLSVHQAQLFRAPTCCVRVCVCVCVCVCCVCVCVYVRADDHRNASGALKSFEQSTIRAQLTGLQQALRVLRKWAGQQYGRTVVIQTSSRCVCELEEIIRCAASFWVVMMMMMLQTTVVVPYLLQRV